MQVMGSKMSHKDLCGNFHSGKQRINAWDKAKRCFTEEAGLTTQAGAHSSHISEIHSQPLQARHCQHGNEGIGCRMAERADTTKCKG